MWWSWIQVLHPATYWICSQSPPSLTLQLYCVNSQLVCLLPVGIFLPAFHVYLKLLFLKGLHKCYINYKSIFIFFFPHDHKTIHLIDACTRLLFLFFLRICYQIKQYLHVNICLDTHSQPVCLYIL